MAFRTSDYDAWLKLNQGEFGEVYRVKQKSLDRFVCIKRSIHMVSNAEMQQRMKDEALSMAQLQHSNLVGIYDFGSDEKWNYIVMEYVYGVGLDALDTLDWKFKIHALTIACEGISAIHRRGWVHRDLKPTNILVTHEGTCKVADFGLLFRTNKISQTADHAILGTAAYMSPEQVLGKKLLPTSDIFSLGAMLYEIFLEKPPFSRNDVPTTMHAIAYDNCKVDSLPDFIRPVISKCLHKDPDQRYSTVEDLKTALRSIRGVIDSQNQESLSNYVEKMARENLTKSLLDQADSDKNSGQMESAYFHLVEASRLSPNPEIMDKIQTFGPIIEEKPKNLKNKKRIYAGIFSALTMSVTLVFVLYVQRSLRQRDIGVGIIKNEKRLVTYIQNPTFQNTLLSKRRIASNIGTDAALWIVKGWAKNALFFVDGKQAIPVFDTIRIDPGFHATMILHKEDTLFKEATEWRAFEVRNLKR